MMNIGVIGTRGFPGIQGGVETHCMELYTRIAALSNVKITVYRRRPYINPKNRDAKFENIRFVDIAVPKRMYFETFLHSFFSSIHALFQGYDIVHIHNIGPGFFIPLLRLAGVKIVFTYHSISYTHQKWNNFAKAFLYLSEKISLPNTDFVIFISKIIESEMVKKYKIKRHKLIFNGVSIPIKSVRSDYISQLGLEKQKYIIALGRYLEEKGFDYLIRAFKKTNITDYKLVIIGDTDYPTSYSKKFRSFAEANDIILTGFIKGEKLNQVFTNARLFIMSSLSEGLPISLLEAMSYNIDVLVSDIPANLQIGLGADDYFNVGDENALKNLIISKLSTNTVRDFNGILSANFNWDKIALETYGIFKDLMPKEESVR